MTRTILSALLLACGAVHADTIALKKEGGTYVVPVVINDKITLDFTIDSGATDVFIPLDVFSTLVRAGTVLQSDLLDKRVYELADGSQQTSQRFRIRSLKVGSLDLHDVVASVAPQEGSLLLGQSFLSRIKSWSIDNERHMLVFNESPSLQGVTRNSPTGSAADPVAQAHVRTLPPSVKTVPRPVAPRADDKLFMQAVAILLTGDDLGEVYAVDVTQCVFKFLQNYGNERYYNTIHLNNVDRARSTIARSANSGVVVSLRGEGVVQDADPSTYRAGSTEDSIRLPTNEYARVVHAWNYIYSHGCKDRKSSF